MIAKAPGQNPDLMSYLFGNIPIVKQHLSHIIWAMIVIPGLLVLFGAWKARRQAAGAPHLK